MLEAISGALTPFLWGGALALFLNVPLRTIEGWLGRLPPKPRRCAALTVLLHWEIKNEEQYVEGAVHEIKKR